MSADDGAADEAAATAMAVAEHAWRLRHRYRLRATPLTDAVDIAVQASSGRRPPVILADTADNPGGGAPGDSTFLLEALLAAHVTGVVMGLHCDPAVVEAAWQAGVGSRVDVEFNAGSVKPLARPLAATATVLSLADSPIVPTKGVYRGSSRDAGRCCALDLGGVSIAVSSRRLQCADDDTLSHVGLDPRSSSVVVVKSRGHFRAGFAHLFADDQIVEVEAPGVAPAVLAGIELPNVHRPVFPLDPDVAWTPAATLHRAMVAP